MIGTGLAPFALALRRRPAAAAGFDPAALFAGGVPGAFYDPVPGAIFQDAAGTIPADGDAQPVGRLLDRSGNGHHAVQTDDTKRPLFRTDGVHGWLEFDGAGTHLRVAGGIASTPASGALSILASAALVDPTGFTASFRTICAQGAAFEDTGAWSFAWNSDNAEMETLVSNNDLRSRVALAEATLDADFVFSTIATPTLTETWQNGVLLGALGASPFDYQVNDFFIGYDGRPDRYWRGRIGALLVAEADLSAERTALEGWIAERAGVSL